MTATLFLLLTPVAILLYNVVAYGVFEAQREAAVIRDNQLARQRDPAKGAANSKQWHKANGVFTGINYLVLTLLHAVLYGQLGGDPRIFAVFVLVLHLSTRWLVRDAMIYYWWKGSFLDQVPTVEGPWDRWDAIARWVHFHVMNHWVLRTLLVAGFYGVYYLWAAL